MKYKFKNLNSLINEKLNIYPVLTGVLFLFSELRKNSLFYTLAENISLILIVLSFTLLIDYLSRKAIKDKIKAALIATSFIFINLFYQDIFKTTFNIIDNSINFTAYCYPELLIIPLIVLVWITLAFFVLRSTKSLNGLNRYLNFLLIAFILVEIVKWVITPIPQIKLIYSEPFPINTNLLPEQKPNIYYIILDSYTSSESLRKYWNYDNSNFEDSLKQLGFFIEPNTKTAYTSTYYCMASYLNSSLLILDPSKQYNNRNFSQLILNNRLFKWLSANEYLCFNFSIFDAFGSPKYYNVFESDHFLARTIWYINFYKLRRYFKTSFLYSQINLTIFNELNLLAKKRSNKPIFAYAHLMMPHSPYFFDEYGNPTIKPRTLTNKQNYLSQLVFTNALTINLITNILTLSKRKSIIVIQGDHGYRNLVDTTSNARIDEAHTMFYAIYMPNDMLVPNNINPTNTFIKLIDKINHTKTCHKKPLL